jgi:hypothetical protein
MKGGFRGRETESTFIGTVILHVIGVESGWREAYTTGGGKSVPVFDIAGVVERL